MYSIVKRDLQFYVKGENGDRVKYTFDIVKEDGEVIIPAIYKGRAEELIAEWTKGLINETSQD